MTRKKYKGFVGLMGISVLLLFTLQLWWLNTEYRSAADSFNRETNLLFRTSARHLSDSLFFSRFRISYTGDSVSLQTGIPASPAGWLRDSMPAAPGTAGTRSPSIVVRRDTLAGQADGEDGSMTMQISVMGYHADSPYAALPRQFRGNFLDVRQMIDLPPDEELAEMLAWQFREALEASGHFPEFEIVSREIDWFRPGGAFGAPEPHDSLAFTTSFFPFGRHHSFAASFSGVRPLLIRQLLPQIAFSVLITAMILLSFGLIYRNLLSQQRLIAQKNDFIGNMTHELKTPVATVGVALEAMRSFDVLKDPQRTAEYLDMATQELNRLGMMTDKILKTSVLDYGTEIRINSEDLDMAEMIKNVLSSFAILAEQKGMALRFEKSGRGIVKGHREHLTQMVYNLVDNALKYGTGSPQVLVSLSESQHQVSLEVADKGPGIPEAYRDKVFDKFFRVPAGDIHNVKGYGLGLNYVAGVVRAHGGSVRVDSAPGKGARFLVRLPAGAMEGPSDENNNE